MPGSFMGGGGASFPFDRVGDTVTGVIVEPPQERIQTKTDGSGEAKTFPDGTPMTMWQVRLRTNLRDPNNPYDDGERSVFLKWKSLEAVRNAVRAAGAQDILPGGTLTLQYSGDEASQQRGKQPAKLWRAHYVPPPNGFMAQQETAPTQPAQPQIWNPPGWQQQPQQQHTYERTWQPPSSQPQYIAPPNPMHPGPAQPQWNPTPPQYGPPQQYEFGTMSVGPSQIAPSAPMGGPPADINHHGQPQSAQPPAWAQAPEPDPWAGMQASPVQATSISGAPSARAVDPAEQSVIDRLRAQALAGGAQLPPPPQQGEVPGY